MAINTTINSVIAHVKTLLCKTEPDNLCFKYRDHLIFATLQAIVVGNKKRPIDLTIGYKGQLYNQTQFAQMCQKLLSIKGSKGLNCYIWLYLKCHDNKFHLLNLLLPKGVRQNDCNEVKRWLSTPLQQLSDGISVSPAHGTHATVPTSTQTTAAQPASEQKAVAPHATGSIALTAEGALSALSVIVPSTLASSAITSSATPIHKEIEPVQTHNFAPDYCLPHDLSEQMFESPLLLQSPRSSSSFSADSDPFNFTNYSFNINQTMNTVNFSLAAQQFSETDQQFADNVFA